MSGAAMKLTGSLAPPAVIARRGFAGLAGGGPEAVPGLILALAFDADGRAGFLPVERPIDLAVPGAGWLWVHCDLVDGRLLTWLASAAALSPAARMFLLSHDTQQQIEAADGSILAVFDDLVRDLDTPSEEIGQLRIVMTDRLVVTGRRRALQSVESTRQAIAAGRRLPRPESLMAVIVEQILQAIAAGAEALHLELDGIEDRILDDSVSDERRGLGGVRRTAARLHRRLAVLAALFARLEEETDEEDAEAPELLALRPIAGPIVRRLESLHGKVLATQERGRLLQDEITAKLATETNRRLHALSIVTALFLPPALVAGIFGMNTKDLPLLETAGGSFWALGLCAASSLGVYLLMKKLGIFD
jgi:zinc transporter